MAFRAEYGLLLREQSDGLANYRRRDHDHPGGAMKLLLSLLCSCLLIGCAPSTQAASLSPTGSTGVLAGQSTLPIPPTGAVAYQNLQINAGSNPGSWALCTGTACAGGTNTGSGSQAFSISSPSLSGAAESVTSNGNGFNVLAYRKMAQGVAPTGGTNTSGTLTLTVPTPTTSANTITFNASAVDTSVPTASAPSGGTNTVNTLTLTVPTPSTSGNNVTIGASSSDTLYTVTAIQIYVDGNPTPVFNSGSTPPITPISYTISGLAVGTHTAVVKSFNSHGDVTSVSVPITVTGTHVTGIQIYLDGNPTPVFNSATTAPITPINYTLTGLSEGVTHSIEVKAFNSGTNIASVTTTVAFGPTISSIAHIIDDLWFYIPSSATTIQAIEFDPDIYDGSYEYFLSMQCDSASGKWRFWDMFHGDWTILSSGGGTIPTYACTTLSSTNVWHHFQLYGTYDQTAHTYTYETFVLDGSVVYSNIGNTYSAKTLTATPSLIFEHQVDNNSSATSNTLYYDNENGWTW
ncbi:MAG: hypothetical protein ABI076_03785 [Acidobacteriaceae bacterium]